MLACNTSTTQTTATTTDSTVTVNGTTSATATTTTSTTYASVEGDVSFCDGKVLAYRNNAWTESKKNITLDGSIVVRLDGRVERNGKEAELSDGRVVTKTGRFLTAPAMQSKTVRKP